MTPIINQNADQTDLTPVTDPIQFGLSVCGCGIVAALMVSCMDYRSDKVEGVLEAEPI